MTYVRNAWYVAGWAHEVEAGKPFAMSILGEPLVIYRGESGRVMALEDRCVHRLAPLSLGRCEGESLRCMYHGMLFGPDGKATEIPGQDMIPPQARVRSYPVAERHSWIWVWMGAQDAADESLIPPAVGYDDPDYLVGHGQMDYAAEARLINDNLLDFSHISYVHAHSFKPSADFAERPARITPLARGIRYERWVENSLGSATRPTEVPMDSYRTYDYLIPGVLLMKGGVFPLGTAKACDYQMPDFDQAVSGVTFTSQAVTPMREKTSRYMFMWGPHRKHGGESTRDMLLDLAAKAFAEDKDMIEGQQRVIDATPDPKVMPTAHDRGVTMFNRLVEKMVRLERAEQRQAA